MSYLENLDRELRDRGVDRKRRRRILAEFGDHLRQNPSADLGEPVRIADQFADQLGTQRARTAAIAAFAALAFAGLLMCIRVAATLPLIVDGSAVDQALLLVAVLAGQVALAAGGLAILRALRLRGQAIIPRREAVLLARRAWVGLAAGTLTIIALPLTGTNSLHPGLLHVARTPTNWTWPAMSAIGLLALAAAVPAVVQAVRLRPMASGPAGDLLTDLGLIVTPLRTPTRLALLFAATLALILTATGIAAGDPYDGALRGILEAVACLAGYGVLGRYLGLRHLASSSPR